jgi:quercetin dioxygenase-like cupin family protein
MTDKLVRDQQPRLRQNPSDRFAGASHVVDVGAALRELRAEVPATHRGHRQVTLLKQGTMTQVLFSFDPGSELQDHVTHGLVTIYVLEGNLIVNADGQAHALSAGYMLVLNPDVAHDVRATDTSAMLLTVQMDGTHDAR